LYAVTVNIFHLAVIEILKLNDNHTNAKHYTLSTYVTMATPCVQNSFSNAKKSSRPKIKTTWLLHWCISEGGSSDPQG